MTWQQEYLRMRVVTTCTETFPCIFVQCLRVQGKDSDGPLCAAGSISTEQALQRRTV
jgi:hypothetical protein